MGGLVDEGALVEDLNVDTGVVNAGLGRKAYYKAVYVAEPLVVKTAGGNKSSDTAWRAGFPWAMYSVCLYPWLR
ncbi:hypothetical protein Pogu_0204 [Pyrobaculum oguniense TE7]|uniref:Uncharacterized protein n=1 Tax=Pyrobaculum oguniense (strain DSM 13380 / JCM 10595 / TE7) TaxID=698757 RepID=H6Q6K1_PYROT|nr:hypothetical protein Pogu_0204 [Pyrobaculum oguniense TE7]